MAEITVAAARKHFREAEACLSASEYQRQEGDIEGATLEAAHAQTHALLALAGHHLVGESDGPDAEIEQLHTELHRIREMALVVLDRLPDDEDQSAEDLVREILTERDDQRAELVGYRKRSSDHLLRGGKLVEQVRAALRVLTGSVCTNATIGIVGEHVGLLCEEVERLRGLVGDEDVDTQWRGLSRSDVIALAELLKHAVRTYRENDDLAMAELSEAERKRERLTEERDLFRGVVASIKGAIGHAERLAAAMPTEPERETCTAEPRRWRRSDPEPEIGTTVDPGGDRVTYTRRNDGTWHRNSCHCGIPLDCDSSGHYGWEYVTRDGAVVEVVSTDGTGG